MKPITMFMMRTCPHCQRAFRWMDEVKAEHPEYERVDVTMIDEREKPEVAAQYDYYYVPTYFVGDKKMHEGVCAKEIVENVYKAAYEG